MRIVIDGRFWDESGIGRYLRNLVTELGKIEDDNEYFILLLKKDWQTNIPPNFHKVEANFKWYGFNEQIKLPRLLNSLKPDLVHFPHFNVPIFYRGKFVVTIHDLIHQHFQTRDATTRNPVAYWIKKKGYRRAFTAAIKKSARIIVPSEAVKKQLEKEWSVKEEKITVTYEGVNSSLIDIAKSSKEGDFAKVAAKWQIKKPYLFYVGNAQPHKNINKLIDAYLKVKTTHPDLKLVLSGPEHFFWEKIKQQHKLESIIFTGFVSEKELVTLYTHASAYVFPSLEEGFGIPLLEAMACETPVVASEISTLKEVGGEAVIYFDPNNVEDMAEKISQVLDNKKLRESLVKKGELRYKQFSWKKMAKETVEVYQEALS